MDFNEVYKKHEWIININAKKYSRTSGEDEDELKSLLNFEMWLIYKRFDSNKGCLERFLNISLQGKIINYIQKKNNEFNRQADPISYIEEEMRNKEGGKYTTFEIKSDYNLLNHVLERNGGFKSDEDKQQLISALTSNTDSTTTAIVNEFLVDSEATPTAIGRKLGIHHQQVRRKLDSLARKYYANHDEDINEYLVT